MLLIKVQHIVPVHLVQIVLDALIINVLNALMDKPLILTPEDAAHHPSTTLPTALSIQPNGEVDVK